MNWNIENMPKTSDTVLNDVIINLFDYLGLFKKRYYLKNKSVTSHLWNN